ncbi:MAG: HAMP domain-containing protein [Clostridiales bacterium]|nr:HAMP domain-containing protein [Clostridiales bacterium]
MKHLSKQYPRRRLTTEKFFSGKKALFHRIIRYNLLLVMLPVLVFMFFYMSYYQEKQISFETKKAESYLEQAYYNVCNNIMLIRSLAQTTLTDETLFNAFHRAQLNKMDMLELKRETVVNMQNLKLANPAVNSVRFFYKHPTMMDIPPSLFSMEKMLASHIEEQLCGQEHLWLLGSNDGLLREEPAGLYAIFYQAFNTLEGKNGGYIEISMDMKNFLSDMSRADKDFLMGLRLKSNALYYNYSDSVAEDAALWSLVIPELTQYLQQEKIEEPQIRLADGRYVYIAMKPIEEIGCSLFYVQEITTIYSQNILFFAMCLGIFLATLILLFLVTRYFTYYLLKRMYLLIANMRQVSEGDFSIRAQVGYQDEIDELAIHFNYMIDALESVMQANHQRQLIVRRAEIRALHNQINTHFLYNTLETIRMMAILDDNKQIADSIHHLASLLKYTLHLNHTMVTVQAELQNLKDYVDLMRLRWDESIILDIQVSEQLLQQEICKLTLQPILENALIHGAEPMKNVTIRIWGEEEKETGCYRLCIEDHGGGMSAETLEKLQKILDSVPGEISEPQSVGLYNVNNRIKLYFGTSYGLWVESKQYHYTRVWVRLPMQKM